MRTFVALRDRRVVAWIRSERAPFTHAVLHTGHAGTFVTFHRGIDLAWQGMAFFQTSAPHKAIVPAVETAFELHVGALYDETEGRQ